MTRKLDALFAEKVLGWEQVNGMWRSVHRPLVKTDPLTYSGFSFYESGLPHFTTSLDTAWSGVEKLRLNLTLDRCPDGTVDVYGENSDSKGEASDCGTPALAIVLACLRAVGVSEQAIDEAQRGE